MTITNLPMTIVQCHSEGASATEESRWWMMRFLTIVRNDSEKSSEWQMGNIRHGNRKHFAIDRGKRSLLTAEDGWQ